jgi:hypothetical protein
MLDRSRYPLLAEYLEGLPGGLDAYPDCEGKASLITSALEGHDVEAMTEGLPPLLRDAIGNPMPAGLWAPAVLCDAVFFAVCDRYYPTEAAVRRWTHERTTAMADNVLYRALLRVPGPKILLKAGARAHGLFQRGTRFDLELKTGRAVVTLSFPPRLHVGLNLVANVALWQALVEITGGKNVQSQLVSQTATRAAYLVTYD